MRSKETKRNRKGKEDVIPIFHGESLPGAWQSTALVNEKKKECDHGHKNNKRKSSSTLTQLTKQSQQVLTNKETNKQTKKNEHHMNYWMSVNCEQEEITSTAL